MSEATTVEIQGLILSTMETDLTEDHFSRPHGSYCAGKGWQNPYHIMISLGSIDWSEVNPADLPDGVAFPGCRYFTGTLRDIDGGMTAAVDIDTLTDEERDTVVTQTGHHGNEEMVSTAISAKPTDKVCIIVGPYKGKTNQLPEAQVIWTWYPGEFTRREHTVKLAR